jgi:hypothetical protein
MFRMPTLPSPPGKVLPHRTAANRASGSLAVLPPVALFEAVHRSKGDVRLVMRHPTSGGLVVVVFRRGDPAMVFSPGDGRSVGELLLAAGVIDRSTLTTLVEERTQGPSPLERLVLEKTTLTRSEVQRFLDYQARMRLLDALLWREGFFELEGYTGGGEADFRLDLPNLTALAVRAEARYAALPRLFERLPASPAHTIVRRRRGGAAPSAALPASIFAALQEPLLVPQLVARLLIDDDLVIQAVLDLVAGKVLALAPRVELATADGPEVGSDPRCAALVRDVLERTRGAAAAERVEALWVVVVAASAEDAARFVTRLGGEPGVVMVTDAAGADTGLASRTLRLGEEHRLCLLAVRPEVLSRGAMEGMLARCDAVAFVRVGDDAGELDRLQRLRRLAQGPGFGWQPLSLGVDLGAPLRAWGDFPDAVLGIPDWESRTAAWLVEKLLESLQAAVSCRTT